MYVPGMCVCVPQVSKAYISDMTVHSPKEHRQMAMAYQAASFSLARAVSSAVIGLVYSLTPKHGWVQFAVRRSAADYKMLCRCVFVFFVATTCARQRSRACIAVRLSLAVVQ